MPRWMRRHETMAGKGERARSEAAYSSMEEYLVEGMAQKKTEERRT